LIPNKALCAFLCGLSGFAAMVSYFRTVQEQEPSITEQFDKTTGKIPWLGRQYLSARLFVIAVVVMAGIIYGLVVSTRPTEENILTETVWRADTIMVGINRLQPNTFGRDVDPVKGTAETFQLKSDGQAILPGFNSEPVYAKWRSEKIYIEIYDADTFGNIYNGVYEYFITTEFLKLVSEDVVISGSRNGVY